MSTGIEWTDETWNPVVGCERVSPGCAHCYAKTLHDMRHEKQTAGVAYFAPQYDQPFETVQLKPDRLGKPLSWRKPRRVFVNSVSDLFHDDVPDEYIDQVFAVMALAWHHTFQILTKRPERMRRYFTGRDTHLAVTREFVNFRNYETPVGPWPLPNVWLGVSVENQRWADERIPLLLQTPAAVRFLSCEPLLGPVSFRWAKWMSFGSRETNEYDGIRGIDWVICGGESGDGARPMDAEWARTLRDQCQDAGIAFLFKQWGGERNKRGHDAAVLDGRRWLEFPDDTKRVEVPV